MGKIIYWEDFSIPENERGLLGGSYGKKIVCEDERVESIRAFGRSCADPKMLMYSCIELKLVDGTTKEFECKDYKLENPSEYLFKQAEQYLQSLQK